MRLGDYDVARRAFDTAATGEPITFVLGGHEFRLLDEPSLGDAFGLVDVPEIDLSKIDLEHYDESSPEGFRQLLTAILHYIERMVVAEQRVLFRATTIDLPRSHAPVVVQLATDVTEALSARPTVLPTSSSRGQRTTGATSKRTTGGGTRSNGSRRGSGGR